MQDWPSISILGGGVSYLTTDLDFESERPRRSPVAVLLPAFAGVAVLISAVLIPLQGTTVHWVGYGIALFAVVATIFLRFWLRREALRGDVGDVSSWRWVMPTLQVGGIAITVVHAYLSARRGG